MVSIESVEYQPDYVSLPGGTLQDILEERGMPQSQLARRTGLSPKHINQIINGKIGISADVAISLENVLGVPARFWLAREARYREYKAREEKRQRLADEISWTDNFPIKKMAEYGYIEKRKGGLPQLQNLLRFFGIASPGEFSVWWDRLQPTFRISSQKKPDKYALAAWLRKGELEASEIDCAPFSKDGFSGVLKDIRALTQQPPERFQTKLTELCSRYGVAVVFVPELPNSYVSGATRWLSKSKALIQLSFRFKTADMLWFAFFHEACHVIKHHKKRSMFLRDDSRDDDMDEEREANKFAANILIPPKEYRSFARPNLTENNIREFSERIGIDPSIVIGRLQHDKYLPYNSMLNKIKTRCTW